MERFRFYSIWLCAVCIFVFLLQLLPGFTELFLLNSQSWVQPWRFLTAIFLHGGLAHLAYNLFALALFGSMLERLIGGRRFLLVFFTSGLLANIVSVNFYPSSLGASGAIFGIIGALVIIRPMLTVWAFGMPMPIFVAGLLWAGGDLLGAAAFFAGRSADNVGNIAHLSGMAVGFIIGFFMRSQQPKPKTYRVEFNEDAIQNWEDRHLIK